MARLGMILVRGAKRSWCGCVDCKTVLSPCVRTEWRSKCGTRTWGFLSMGAESVPQDVERGTALVEGERSSKFVKGDLRGNQRWFIKSPPAWIRRVRRHMQIPLSHTVLRTQALLLQLDFRFVVFLEYKLLVASICCSGFISPCCPSRWKAEALPYEQGALTVYVSIMYESNNWSHSFRDYDQLTRPFEVAIKWTSIRCSVQQEYQQIEQNETKPKYGTAAKQGNILSYNRTNRTKHFAEVPGNKIEKIEELNSFRTAPLQGDGVTFFRRIW